MAEKARAKLAEIQHKWPGAKSSSSLSPEHIMRCFKNFEKVPQEKQNTLLTSFIKPHCTNYDDIKRQYDADTLKHGKTVYEAFVKLVNNAVLMPVAGSKPLVPQKPAKHDFDSPVLSSTRVETKRRSDGRTVDVNVSEVRTGLIYASYNGRSDNMQMNIFRSKNVSHRQPSTSHRHNRHRHSSVNRSTRRRAAASHSVVCRRRHEMRLRHGTSALTTA